MPDFSILSAPQDLLHVFTVLIARTGEDKMAKGKAVGQAEMVAVAAKSPAVC